MLVGLATIILEVTTDIHVIHEGEVGAASYYVQAVPAIVSVDGEESETEFSGKAGQVSPSVAYGEVLPDRRGRR